MNPMIQMLAAWGVILSLMLVLRALRYCRVKKMKI